MTVPSPSEGLRRRLALIVIVVASFASLATGASPSPPPSVSESVSGVFKLSPDEPIAAVEFEVSANAALRSAEGSHTVVKVDRTGARFPAGPESAALLAVEPVGEPDTGPIVAPWPSYQSPFDQACQPAQACSRRYRITAFLVDPSAIDGPIDIPWTAVAETRVGGGAEAEVPLDSSLTVVADEPRVLPATTLVAASLPTEQRTLDEVSPRFTQRITIRQPEGSGGFEAVGFGALLRVEQALDDPDAVRADASIQVFTEDGTLISRGSPNAGYLDIELPWCQTSGGCETPVTIVGEWPGGGAKRGLTLAWSLAAAAFSAEDLAMTPPPGSVSLAAEPVVTGNITPVGLTAGSFAVGGPDDVRRNITAVIPADAIVGDPNGALFALVKLHAEMASRTGAQGPMSISVDQAVAGSEDDADLTVWTRALPVDCSTGVCHVSFQVRASASEHPVNDVTVDWALSLALLAEPPVEVQPGAEARFDVVEVP